MHKIGLLSYVFEMGPYAVNLVVLLTEWIMLFFKFGDSKYVLF